MTAKGFTLLEFLISTALASLILMAGFGFFGHAHSLFFKLKESVEDSQDALSAIDKMRIDLIKAGGGLAFPADAGLPEPLSADAEELTIWRADSAFDLAADITPGDQRASLETTAGLRTGDRICVVGPDLGEALDVIRIEGNVLILGSSFERGYGKEDARVLALEKISYFLDEAAGIIRRRVDSGGAQPLIEGVGSFRFSFDKPSRLVSLAFTLSSRKEKVYEICLLPKNIGLAPGK